MDRLLPLPALILWLASAAWAEEGDFTGRLLGSFEAGVFCAPPTAGTNPAPDTVAGTTHIVDVTPEFLSNSRQVPAVIGLGFGVLAKAKRDDLRDVTMIVTHPPMGPDGVTRQSFMTSITADIASMTYYQFDRESELLPGVWTLEAVHEGETVYRARFTVVPPEALPAVAAACGGSVPVS
jgi:hypothetical protein